MNEAFLKRILESEMSISEKLLILAAHIYNPVTFSALRKILPWSEDGVETLIEAVIKKKNLVKITKENGNHLFFVPFAISSEKKKEKEQVAVCSNKDTADILLFIDCLKKNLQDGDQSDLLSKKDIKHIRKILPFLEEVSNFTKIDKSAVYTDYINSTLSSFGKFWSNHVKFITYGYNKKAWRERFVDSKKRAYSQFSPILLKGMPPSYGVDAFSIPETPRNSPYYTTVWVFLLSKPRSYPICTEVLHALEKVIVYFMWRKQEDAIELIELHKTYKKEYLEAKASGKLETIASYLTKTRLKETPKEEKQNEN